MIDKVTFIRVGIEGFGSIQAPINFSLDAKGINMICGPNGAGKTSVFSAMYWCLYGSLLKEVTASDVPTRPSRRTKDFRGTRVIVDMSKGNRFYRVARHLNFTGTTKGLKGGSSLLLFEKSATDWDFSADDLQGDHKYKDDIEKRVEEVIGVSAKAFLNAILFGQRMKRLVESEGKDKRALFEELFEMSFIEIAKKKAQTKKGELDTAIATIDTNIQNEESLIGDLEEAVERKEKIVAEWENEKAEDVKNTLAKWAEEKEVLASIRKLLPDLKTKAGKYDENKEEKLLQAKRDAESEKDKAEKALSSSEASVSQADREIAASEKQVKKLQEDLEGVATSCPYCSTKLKKESVDAVKKKIQLAIEEEVMVGVELEKNKKQHEEAVKTKTVNRDKAVKSYNVAKKEYDEYVESAKEFKDAVSTLKVEETKLESQQKICDTAKEAWEKAKSKEQPKFDLEPDKIKLKEREETLEKLLQEHDEKSVELGRVQWWIDKGFGAKGLKAYIFNAMLNRLNLYIEKYAELLGVQVKFSVDMSKASKPFTTTCYFEGEQVPYETLSGGEKQRVDVAMAFAMHDLVSHNANVNILIMDEVFEGLDTDGVEAVYELVRLKAEEGKCVYIITHALELDSSFTKRIEVFYDRERKTTVVR